MEFIEPIWKGVVTGLLFTLTFGTVFFSLIQTSIKRGLNQSLFIALGVVLSDAFFIAVAVLGTSFIVDEMIKFNNEIRGVGFVFLMIIGLRSILKKEVDHSNDAAPVEKKDILYVLKGIMLNSINPMILVSWMALTTYVKTVYLFNLNQVMLFYLVVLATMFFTMFAIAYFAGKLRHILSKEYMHKLNVGSGIVFIIFAIVIVWPFLENAIN
ncbi:MAG: LysE family transporter [Bacteroidia bacterium]|jgi:threonine/homoserine/homoserine lactone efflux protein|nr:LysE family transporter [Bacteroidia bacterium]